MKNKVSIFNINMALEKFRNLSYKLLDVLHGLHVKKHYDDIKFIMQNYGSEKAIQKREAYLNDILNHAVTTCTYFEQFKNYNSICRCE